MKKTLNILRKVLVWAVVALAVCMMMFTLLSSRFNRTDRSLFGYRAFLVLSDSMRATDFGSGDLVVVRQTDPATLKEGDIIAYISQNSYNFGETVTHKIRRLTTDENGNPGFITYGTTTDTDDETVVTYPYVLGKYRKHFPGVGRFFFFLKTVPGYIVCILIPFLAIILMEGLHCISLFRQMKAEQNRSLQEERSALDQEREENRKMLEEIRRMQQELRERSDASPSDGNPAEPSKDSETPSFGTD